MLLKPPLRVNNEKILNLARRRFAVAEGRNFIEKGRPNPEEIRRNCSQAEDAPRLPEAGEAGNAASPVACVAFYFHIQKELHPDPEDREPQDTDADLHGDVRPEDQGPDPSAVARTITLASTNPTNGIWQVPVLDPRQVLGRQLRSDLARTRPIGYVGHASSSFASL